FNSLGWASGVLLGETLSMFMLNYIYILFGCFPLISAVILIFVKEPHSISKKKEDPLKKEKMESHFRIAKPFLLFIAMIIIFRHLTSQGSVISLLPNYLGLRLNITGFERGFIFSLNSFLQVFLMIPIGMLVDKIGRRNVILMGVIGTMITSIGYGVSVTSLQIIPFQVTMAISWSAIISGCNAYVIDVTIPEDRAKGMGILNAGFSIGGTIGPILAGLFLFISFENFQFGFFAVSLFSIPAIVLCCFLVEHRKDHVYKFLWQKGGYRTKPKITA
ncbi:MAG: MFS transporter, partial [Candidatus Helarchaeota archaeon]